MKIKKIPAKGLHLECEDVDYDTINYIDEKFDFKPFQYKHNEL